MTDSSSWKLIRIRSFIPIRSHARRNSAVVINLERHGRFVTDKCFMRLTERNRRNYGFYIKPVRDFRKLRRRHIRVRFRPIRKTPGFCGFWKGYRLPSIQVNLHFWFLIETVAVSASDKVRQWTRVNNEKPACVFERRSELYTAREWYTNQDVQCKAPALHVQCTWHAQLSLNSCSSSEFDIQNLCRWTRCLFCALYYVRSFVVF